ncbi:mevalonate kinase [Capsaspora owczarzaki ATCC 30864]|uniref:mevalonate kinase n=1 Tax=Capsaspora owczarzaki (strain ATCC 30864) TaxID=595528 RepID=UPI0003523FA6|nr:mevalonate kinase [Capsaspora owczarzaki ATCC 30864]|eukprot:XP_004365210.2 mevalonate kinase [Capsaspora owczarzaki ATCC 30864]
MQLVVSAPGKVILHGEHAVVYGKTALATALDMRTSVRLAVTEGATTQGTESRVALADFGLLALTFQTADLSAMGKARSDPVGVDREALLSDIEAYLANHVQQETTPEARLALKTFLQILVAVVPHERLASVAIQASVQSALPIGAGLGSSAAFAVCIATVALLIAGSIQQTSNLSPSQLELINKWALYAETTMHGTPSGVDNTVGTYGGLIQFARTASGINMTPLTDLPKLRILLVNTQQSRSTKALVANVRTNFDKFPSIVPPVIDLMETIGVQALADLRKLSLDQGASAEIYERLKFYISANHALLSVVQVDHPKLVAVRSCAERFGFGCKLTGAGGGGCAFILLPPDASPETVAALVHAITNLHVQYNALLVGNEEPSQPFLVWETNLGSQGVRIDTA